MHSTAKALILVYPAPRVAPSYALRCYPFSMQALEFWKIVTVDHANLLESLISLLNQHRIKYCVIGGQGVNAYAEPVVSLDLDLAMAVEQMSEVERLLREHFAVKRFPHSLNASVAD